MVMGFMLVATVGERHRRIPLLALIGWAGLTLGCSSASEVDILQRFHLDEPTELTHPQAVILDRTISSLSRSVLVSRFSRSPKMKS